MGTDVRDVRPLVSVIIPTIGRDALGALLATIPDEPWIEVVIVGDSHKGEFTDNILYAQRRYRTAQQRWFMHDGGCHAWGHPQRNRGMEEALGEYLVFSQDDNVFAPDAFESIRRAIQGQMYRRPLLFRIMTWQAGIVWVERGRLKLGEIDADCIVAPNQCSMLGRWTTIYNGDWDFIKRTFDLWSGDVEWRDELIGSALPGIERHPE